MLLLQTGVSMSVVSDEETLRDLIELQEVAIVPLTESSFKTQTI